MRIGELAARTGVSVRALRYYEEQELLVPARSESGQRHYPESAVDRVQLIQTLYAAGLPSRTILDLLPCVDAKVNTPQSRALLRAERDRIDARIARLARARDRLDAVITHSEGPDSECAYLDADPPPGADAAPDADPPRRADLPLGRESLRADLPLGGEPSSNRAAASVGPAASRS